MSGFQYFFFGERDVIIIHFSCLPFSCKEDKKDTLITRITMLYFVKSMMLSMLGFSPTSVIIVISICVLKYIVRRLMFRQGCGGHLSYG